MSEFVIVAEEDQSWTFVHDDFARRLQQRWPNAKIGIDDLPESPMRLHALIPFPEAHRELGIALADTGDGISLDPADPATAAEFAAWLIEQIPNFDIPLNISGLSEWRPLPLIPGTTEQTIAAHLATF